MRTIILAWDLNEDGRHAADVAFDLARAYGARLYLLYVAVEGVLSEDRVRRRLDSEITHRIRAGGDGGAANRYEAVVRRGEFPEGVTAFAREVKADLVVFGPNRRGGTKTTLLGTSPERVLRGARASVLIVPAPLDIPPRSILVPVGRVQGSTDLDLVRDWFISHGVQEVTVLQVSDYASPAHRKPHSLPREDISAQLGLSEGVEGVTVLRIETWSAPTVKEGILSMVEQKDPSLVVMRTSPEGLLGRITFGSVASEVCRAMDRPLLLTPPP